MSRIFTESFLAATLCTLLIIFSIHVTSAQVRTSSNYQLQSDSINIGGGLSSSTNYRQESTVGEIATGVSDSDNYSLRAGYQQLQEVYISISDAADVVMSPDLPGLTGGESNGSTTVVVTTDSSAGYQLTIESATAPAMQSVTDSIADYADGGQADFVFATVAGESSFGFSPAGVDTVQYFLDDGGTCGVSTSNTVQACWSGLSTSGTEIARASNPNHPNGATTTVFFRVGVGANAGVAPGVYTATTTMTALAL